MAKKLTHFSYTFYSNGKVIWTATRTPDEDAPIDEILLQEMYKNKEFAETVRNTLAPLITPEAKREVARGVLSGKLNLGLMGLSHEDGLSRVTVAYLQHEVIPDREKEIGLREVLTEGATGYSVAWYWDGEKVSRENASLRMVSVAHFEDREDETREFVNNFIKDMFGAKLPKDATVVTVPGMGICAFGGGKLETVQPKRKPGRPKGSKNKPKGGGTGIAM